MKVLTIPRYEEPCIAEMENTLEAMQEYVMGNIETVTLSDTAILVCNEEGKLTAFTPNRILKVGKNTDVIRGDFFICGWKGEDFCDISDEDAKKYIEMFSHPKLLFAPVWAKVSRMWKVFAATEEGTAFCFYELLQCNEDYAFASFEYAIKKYTPNISDYKKVYRGTFEMDEKFDVSKECEQLYMEHNGVIIDRKGRSMSMSDILVMYLPNGKRYVYVDTFGFTEVKIEDDGKILPAK